MRQGEAAMCNVVLLRCLFCFGGCMALAWSQSVRWEAGREDGPTRFFHLVFDQAEPVGQVSLPQVPGVFFAAGGKSESTNNLNGETTRSLRFLYSVVRHGNSPIVIPEFEVMTNKGALRVASAEIPLPAISIDSIARSRLAAGRASVWAGEVFDLSYECEVVRKRNPQISPVPEWRPTAVLAEAWSKPAVSEVIISAERWVKVAYRSRAVIRAANSVQIEPVGQRFVVSAESPAAPASSKPSTLSLSVRSNYLGLEVRPLPAPPKDFSGAVGQFKLTSHVVPEQVAAHEPITWTLTVSGSGNWPDTPSFPHRQASNDFEVVVAKPKHTAAQGNLFEASIEEDAVLFPSRPGSYTLGPVRFVFFDPQTGKFVALETPESKVTVTPGTPPRPLPPPVSDPAPKAGEKTFGGTTRKVAVSPDSSDATRDVLELKLEGLRQADSPAELFRRIRQAEGKAGPATGKD